MMNKTAVVFLVISSLCVCLPAQIVIENPAKPSDPRAGRIVTLEEVLRIEDTGEDFYLKSPWKIRISPRGDLFVQDGQDQALLFDPQGRFVRNVLKKGQGPGEMNYLTDIWASEDRLFLLGAQGKILALDYEGQVIRELNLHLSGYMRFILADAKRILLHKEGNPDLSRGTGFLDAPIEIIEVSKAEGTAKTIGLFSRRVYFEVFQNRAISETSWNQFQSAALDKETILVNSTPEYLVEAFAWSKGKVVGRFKRPYKRMKRNTEGGVGGGGGNSPPPPEFEPDIYALHGIDGKVLVQTSTVLKDKGILFDVFDREGRYVDNFYLHSENKSPSGKLYNKTFTFSGGFAYFLDKNEEGFAVIKKCRLIGF
jgi:hypothetical protein